MAVKAFDDDLVDDEDIDTTTQIIRQAVSGGLTLDSLRAILGIDD